MHATRTSSRQGTPVSPDVPGPVAAAAAATFGGLSRARGARIFHPRGVGYAATVAVESPQPHYRGVALLERPARHRAVVRFSRALGLPEPVPDILGMALRISDLHGAGRHQDFLLVTSLDAPLLRHLFLPAPRGFLGQSYSSLLPYRIGGRIRLVGAEPLTPSAGTTRGEMAELTGAAEAGDLRFRLTLAPLAGRWSPVAFVEIGERLDDAIVERLALNPWNTGGGIRPTGPLMGIRRAAYAGSQRGRGLRSEEIP